MAFFLNLYLNSIAQGDFTLQRLLTETGIRNANEIVQNIMNQVTAKTDLDNLRLRSTLDFLKNPDDIDLQDELGELMY